MKKNLSRFGVALLGLILAGGLPLFGQSPVVSFDESLKRVSADVEYLASDELEGRGVETEGIHKAADYIVDEFKAYGIKPGGKDGSYEQKFPVPIGRQMDKDATSLKLVGPMNQVGELKLDEDFQSMMPGGDADIDGAEVVFVGYGISAEEHNYDEFADLDVDGKVVIILTGEPQQDDENSVFSGTRGSRYSRPVTKFRAAKAAGAAAVILVRDAKSAATGDDLPQSSEFGTRFPNSARIPFAFVKRSVVDDMLSKAPVRSGTGDEFKSLADIEANIDENLSPLGQPINGWKVSFATKFNNEAIDAFNVIGVIEGEGPNADEVIVIGAHYDHLGLGPYGSRTPNRKEVHNGADDNATGTAAILELARRFAKYEKKPGRTLVFVAFSGEERGLVGSRYWVDEEPLFELEKTVSHGQL